MEIAIVLWIFFGIVTAIVASGKGRSGCGWFLIGVLFGPFGLIAAFAVGSSYQCPKCKKGIDKEATICPYCRTEFGKRQQ